MTNRGSVVDVVLASSSPRRRWLLESAGLCVEVVPPAVDETPRPDEAPRTLVERLAEAKAAQVMPRVEPGSVVIAADTIVVAGEGIIGKPRDAKDAAAILRRLSGTRHEVITGYCVRRGETIRVESVLTGVFLRALTSLEIDRYVASKEPLDKAGAYGIQDDGGALVEAVEGSYTNVIGLPLSQVLAAIRDLPSA